MESEKGVKSEAGAALGEAGSDLDAEGGGVRAARLCSAGAALTRRLEQSLQDGLRIHLRP